jgi:metal-responsive CopG/Arc/MetJ family transcriptional regulator
MALKKEPETMLTARVPTKLVKELDKAAERARRSRSAEVIVRLQATLKADRARARS